MTNIREDISVEQVCQTLESARDSADEYEVQWLSIYTPQAREMIDWNRDDRQVQRQKMKEGIQGGR